MILVTGGAGFIGSHLVSLLVEQQQEVRVLELPHASISHLPLQKIEVVRGDIRNRNDVREAVRGCHQVYHLAANPNLWTRRRRDFDAVNHQGTVHVLEESLAAGASRILHVSTESILTSKDFRGGAVELLRPRREDMVGPYCRSKLDAEVAAFRFADQGAPVLVASPTLPIGPGDNGLSPPSRMTLACLQGRLPAYLDCQFNMIDVRDIALGLYRVMERGVPSRRYLLGAWNIELAEWLRRLSGAVNRKPPTWRVSYSLALAVGWLSERIADVTGKMPNATVTGVRLTRYCMHFDPSATLHELELVPRPLEATIADIVAEARQSGRI
ncbi:NAD-dependent epimerase/dehydratase family protein [bacterium]|nr:NAD-dependent epimerase/dehydratase family protein [bacterium]